VGELGDVWHLSSFECGDADSESVGVALFRKARLERSQGIILNVGGRSERKIGRATKLRSRTGEKQGRKEVGEGRGKQFEGQPREKVFKVFSSNCNCQSSHSSTHPDILVNLRSSGETLHLLALSFNKIDTVPREPTSVYCDEFRIVLLEVVESVWRMNQMERGGIQSALVLRLFLSSTFTHQLRQRHCNEVLLIHDRISLPTSSVELV